jgi:hypothetical protein
MTRPRHPTPDQPRRRASASVGERVRRRLYDQPELELTDEELRALADEGIDPDDVRRLARERRDADEVSEHDRDTARDDVEGLALERESEGY